MSVYLDNAATTPLDPEVFRAMEPYLFSHFGNPSSAHHHGREARLAIERSRSTIAGLLDTEPSAILFTSGGTEGDNTAILSAIRGQQIKLAITTPFEHHAVLNPLKKLEKSGKIRLVYLRHDAAGNLSLLHLEELLSPGERAFVSVMHGNNETGNLNDLEAIGAICSRYGAILHSDTVQTMGHYPISPSRLHADFLVGSAHKFHGPKGVGFLCSRKGNQVLPLISGGSQENQQRGGTENVPGIVGLARALEISCRQMESDAKHIQGLKNRMISRLNEQVPGVGFNGNSRQSDRSLYTILSVSLPPAGAALPLLTYLDSHQISASAGSACTSRASRSHVLEALGTDPGRIPVRFSFSRYTTAAEIDYAVGKLAEYVGQGVEVSIAS